MFYNFYFITSESIPKLYCIPIVFFNPFIRVVHIDINTLVCKLVHIMRQLVISIIQFRFHQIFPLFMYARCETPTAYQPEVKRYKKIAHFIFQFTLIDPITPEQVEQVQHYFPENLHYIFIILHHSQYRFQLFNKKCDVNKTIHIC